MKKLLVVLLLSIFLFSASAESFSLRNGVTFSDTKADIISKETLPQYEDTALSMFNNYNEMAPLIEPTPPLIAGEVLFFGPETVAGVPDSYVEYIVNDDGLWALGYSFRMINAYVDYQMISASMAVKYGAPIATGNYIKEGLGRTVGDLEYWANQELIELYVSKAVEEWVVPQSDYDVKIEHVFLKMMSFPGIETVNGKHYLTYTKVDKIDVVNVDSGDL